MVNILIISDTDSRVNWSKELATSLAKYYSTALVSLVSKGDKPYDLNSLDSKEVWRKLKDARILIIALGGGANYKCIKKVRSIFETSKEPKRPIIITGFNGITDPHNIHSLNCRLGSDIICVNTIFDYEVFNEYLRKLSYQQSPLHLLGFLQTTSTMKVNFFQRYECYDRKLVFIVQPDVPNSLTERFYIIENLVQLAKKNPNWGVFIKARSQVGETNVTHRESYPYEIIYENFEQLDNIHFIYGDMMLILDSLVDKDLVLSVGSTVIMHCLKKGVNVGVISDFGIRVDYGTEHFVGSNIFIEFSAVNEINIQKLILDKNWMEKYIDFNTDETTSHLYDVVESLYKKQKTIYSALPFPKMIYGDSFSKYLSLGYSIKKSDRTNFKLSRKYPILSKLIRKFK
ncbi:DUF6716 putative glycosyltransferase [Psychrobacter sp. AOP7-C1-14]|uniref:DUF6716 putative glycosyltransferase n=1 Tax=Psychrobacter sp. AOP7-C1-14 TaxID=3457640 RepID=UPI00402B4024